jgi:hypothetical protein
MGLHGYASSAAFLGYDEAESPGGVAALSSGVGPTCFFSVPRPPDYRDFLSKVEQNSFVAAVYELRMRNFRDLTLANLPADSDTVSPLQSASKPHGYHCYRAQRTSAGGVSKLERRPNENS